MKLYYLDDGPDERGRRRFELVWEDPLGAYRKEPSVLDGQPVGYRRAQVFHDVPAEHVERLQGAGCVVTEEDGPSPYEATKVSRRRR